jgi:Rrf2 family protein
VIIRCEDVSVEITAKAEYAVRAALVLAAHEPDLVKAEAIVSEQPMPRKYVESILCELRRAGLVRTRRGIAGGHMLARPASQISLGSVIRAVDGPLTEIHGLRPHERTYDGAAVHLSEVWIAMRSSLRQVLDETTLRQVIDGRLRPHVRRMAETADAWLPR